VTPTNSDLDLMEVELSNQDLATIYLALGVRLAGYTTEDHPQTQRCQELRDLFARAQKNSHVGILFTERAACSWNLNVDTDAWHGDCGIIWMFGEGTPTENEVSFCPQCGRRLEERS